jgi:large subunit ribosomal protein L10
LIKKLVMTKDQKNEVIELLKEKFTQYNNFYITDTEALTVAQVSKLRRTCFDKQVELKVAKNTLIRKALESLDTEKYAGIYDSLHNVTALMFSENPKEPALIISSFRKASATDKPVLKAAFINGDVYTGNENLKALTQIKTKNELIGEVIGLLQSPAKRVIAALLHHHEKQADSTVAAVIEATPEATPEAVAPEVVAEVVVESVAPEVVAEAVAPEVVAEVVVETAPEASAPEAEA